MCKEKIKNEKGGAFRCKLCDYDICIKCVKRKDLSEVAEDLIRSDRGVKVSIMGRFVELDALTMLCLDGKQSIKWLLFHQVVGDGKARVAIAFNFACLFGAELCDELGPPTYPRTGHQRSDCQRRRDFCWSLEGLPLYHAFPRAVHRSVQLSIRASLKEDHLSRSKQAL